MTQYNDANPEETREWLDALRSEKFIFIVILQ